MNVQGRSGVIFCGRTSFDTDGRSVRRMDLVSSRKSLPHANELCGKVMFSQSSVSHSVHVEGWGSKHATCIMNVLFLPPLDIPYPLLLTFGGHLWRPVSTCALEVSSPNWYWHLMEVTETLMVGSDRYVSNWNTVLLLTTKEGNVLTSVCLSTGGLESVWERGGVCTTPRAPILTSSCGHLSGRYTSYWNAFLFCFVSFQTVPGQFCFSTVEDIIHTDSYHFNYRRHGN